MDWRRIATAKRDALHASIPPAWRLKDSDIPPASRLRDVLTFICRFLNPLELQITNASAIVILENVRDRKWSAVDVTRAFCHRASLAHQLTNCLSETNFEAAEQRAEELDVILRRTGQTIGPLHGLPISLKDRFNVEGLDSACGYVSWIGKRKKDHDEGALVRRLKQAGAIIVVKTNVPTSMLIGETTNNIVGSTINPFNRNLTAGGASGGEGALLALRGSPIGFGSDISGSIRIPCAFNNLFGLRPSIGRISASGLTTSLPGLPTGMSVVGPMCADIESLSMVTQWAIDADCWQDDYEVIDMPWRSERLTETERKACQLGKGNEALVFGVLETDNDVVPHPPIQRAMRIVSEALQQQGYEVIEWSPPPHSEAVDVFYQILGSTAGQAIREAIQASREPPIPQLADLFNAESTSPLTASEFWKLCQYREEYRAKYQGYWKSTSNLTAFKRPVDGVILPVAAHSAPPEGHFKYYAYSALPSLLDFTAGSLPVTFADRFMDYETLRSDFLGAKDRENWQFYDREVFDGSPVGVQIMGQRLQEEKVIAMMRVVVGALKEYRPRQSC